VSAAQTVEPEDDVRPVYPADAGPPNPLAQRFCAALHDMPEQRRATCCSDKPGLVLTSECVRMVSAAIALGAVSLDANDVDGCEKAVQKTYEGCEWPGPFMPDAPDECLGVVKGRLGAGKRCRSSLECEGDMRCQGVSPTTMGRCGPAAADDQRCGGSADALASFTRVYDVDARHPECKGWCNRTKCESFANAGAPCTLAASCGKGNLCVAGKCVAASPGKTGEPCPGGACEKGALCTQGKCVARKAKGARCTTDFECIGGCNKGDAGLGTCGMKCSTR
jgi:hypothetical protein